MAAAGIGNPAGAVPLFDGGNPRVLGGLAHGAVVSGGVLVFASGGTGVVSSGANSFATGSLRFAGDASGTQFTGIALYSAGSNASLAVATRGAFILVANGTVVPGELVKCDGNNAVLPLGSTADSLAKGPSMVVGRALTAGASGGYCIVDIHG